MSNAFQARLGTFLRESRVGGIINRLLSRLHMVIYRSSRGRFGGSIGCGQIIMLMTIGCRTGARRVNPLTTVPLEAGRYAVIGSNAGAPRDPGWALNLRANPEVSIEVLGREIAVHARLVTELAEWNELFQSFVDIHDDYTDYVTHTSRRLPIFVLEPK